MSDKLVEYIQKGMKQGFNTDYIRKVLLKHGYSKAEVEFAIAQATGEPRPKEHKMIFIASGTVVGLLLLLLLIGFLQSRVETRSLQQEVVQKEKTAQDYLDQVADLTQKIDVKERTIEQQLDALRKQESLLKEKDTVVTDMQLLYAQIKEERREVRDLLVELLKEVVTRYTPEQPRMNVTEEQ